MQVVLLILSLVIVINRPVAGAIILADFQQQALAQHNYFRQQLHCTGAMTLNASLNTIAQNYAQYLAANNIFNHSGAAGLGENLYSESSSAIINFVNGKNAHFSTKKDETIFLCVLGSTPSTAWYNEISLYNYNSPSFASATGHFTQVVWAASTQMGIGIALTSNSLTAYVVANYFPAGNVIGQFPANVLPLCTGTTTIAIILNTCHE